LEALFEVKIMYYEEWHECNGMPFVEMRTEISLEEIVALIEADERQLTDEEREALELNDYLENDVEPLTEEEILEIDRIAREAIKAQNNLEIEGELASEFFNDNQGEF
jgi:hypothetical protein